MPACLACGHTEVQWWAEASDEEYLSSLDRFTYYKCNSCGALFIDPVPYADLARIYPPTYYSFDEHLSDSFVFRVKDWLDQKFFKKFIAPLPHEEINILDIGGGTGLQLSSLKKINRRVKHTTIVDIDRKAGEMARQRGHEYFCGPFESYASSRSFEVILMLNLIEHVANPVQLLSKAASLLSPQGILIVKTPNTNSLDAQLFRYKNWGGYHCPRHWVLFHRESFEAMLKGSGLKILHLKYTQGAPFWTTSLMFALHRRKWIDVSPARPVPSHPLYSPLNMGFAMVDLLRGAIAKTSQMMIILGPV